MKRFIAFIIVAVFILSICSIAFAAADPSTAIEGTVTRTSTVKHTATRGDDFYGSIQISTLVPINGASGATFRGYFNGLTVTPPMVFREGSPSYQTYTYSSRDGFSAGSTIQLNGSTPDANNGTTSYRGIWVR